MCELGKWKTGVRQEGGNGIALYISTLGHGSSITTRCRNEL